MSGTALDWSELNKIRLGKAGSLSADESSAIATTGFQNWSISSARRSAVGNGTLVFLGSGDLGSKVIEELKNLGSHMVTIGIDYKISVGSSRADYILLLPEEEGLLDSETVIAMLRRLAGMKLGLMDRALWWLRLQFRDRIFVPSVKTPLLIGEYYGFDAKRVFAAAQQAGYHVLPDMRMATLAMDKSLFLGTSSQHPLLRQHILPYREVTMTDGETKELAAATLPIKAVQTVAAVSLAVESIGVPCVLKPAIGELGYGIVTIHRKEQVPAALVELARQCKNYKVNPHHRILIEPLASRVYVDRMSPDRHVELIQVVVRHRSSRGKLRSTCLPPIWYTKYPPFPAADSGIIAGPTVLDFTIQTPMEDLPELFTCEQYADLCRKSEILVDSMSGGSGVYGIKLFVLPGGQFVFNRMTVRTEDGMYATIPAQESLNCFNLLARIIQNEPLDSNALKTLTHIGGVKTILWEGTARGELLDIQGVEKAGRVRYVSEIVVYKQKRELRPLRMYGLIYVQAPLGTPIEKVRGAMEEARNCITIVRRQ